MKKIICLALFAIMLTVTAQAKVVEFDSRFDTPHGCNVGLLMNTYVYANLGKIPIPGDYGVFVRVDCMVDDDHGLTMGNFTFFFRPVDGEIKRKGDSLYMVDADGTTRIADKIFLGWKTVPGVELVKHFQNIEGRHVVDVSLEIN